MAEDSQEPAQPGWKVRRMTQYEYIVLPTDHVLWGQADAPYQDRLQWGLNRLGRQGWSHTGTNRPLGGQELWTFRRRLHQYNRRPPSGTMEPAEKGTEATC